jgi:glucosyl-3-phosphoglycerate synthase
MTDFLQNGVITTLHNLTHRPVEQLELELRQFARRRPMSLILPSLYSELTGPAMPRIIEELAKVDYLAEIVVGLDQADASQYHHARAFFSVLPQRVHILWNDGPRLRALDAELAEKDLAPHNPGKGRNVWYCIGFTLALGRSQCIGLHDCDILTYDRQIPARLFYPIANPASDLRFCKGYYARVTETGRLSGRVTRLFVTPLLRALHVILGSNDYIEFLDSFRYPLAGEFAMRTDVAGQIRIPDDWGLEVGVLSEVYRNLSRRQICQVDIADNYDHKHQELSIQDPNAGLSRMSQEIAKAIYRKLATEGVVLSDGFFRTLKATYFRTALDMLGQYGHDAKINGLLLDCHAEEQAIETFAQGVILAGETFLANPLEVPFIPNWNRVMSAIPDFPGRLVSAVAADARTAAETATPQHNPQIATEVEEKVDE